jgi:hypothetical protein
MIKELQLKKINPEGVSQILNLCHPYGIYLPIAFISIILPSLRDYFIYG